MWSLWKKFRLIFMHDMGPSGKVYRYKWGLGDVESPFKRHYVVYMPGTKPNIQRMREAAQAFLGTHDFTSFCSARTEVVDRVRTYQTFGIA